MLCRARVFIQPGANWEKVGCKDSVRSFDSLRLAQDDNSKRGTRPVAWITKRLTLLQAGNLRNEIA